MAIKLYDQLEVIPIYQTFIMISWILVGLVVFDEARYYDWHQMIAILASVSLCIVGVKILTSKTKTEEPKRPWESSSKNE